MQINRDSNYFQVNIEGGIPPNNSFGAAWASEPLTNVLAETDIHFALPMPDEDN